MPEYESVWSIVGRQYGEALRKQQDAQWDQLLDAIQDPDKYYRPCTTYKGLAAKRRLYMKAGLA